MLGSSAGQTLGTPQAARLAMVHVHDPRVRWSVPAAGVVRIVPAAEWGAAPRDGTARPFGLAAGRGRAPAVDVLTSLGPLPRLPTRGGRVIVVRGAGGREIALIAAGPIDVGDVDPGDVLALPAMFAATARQIAAIIVAPDASLSLLLELTAVTPPDDTVVGEDLCPSHS